MQLAPFFLRKAVRLEWPAKNGCLKGGFALKDEREIEGYRPRLEFNNLMPVTNIEVL